MKKTLIILSSILALTLFVTACVGGPVTTSSTPPGQGLAYPISQSQQTGLWVNGEGKVTFVPDIAVLSLGIQSQEKTVAQAQNKAREAMNAVLAALKAKNVAEKDIRTQSFSIQPVKQWLEPTSQAGAEPGYKPPPKEVIVGYQVTNSITVKIRKIDEAGSIIDAVAQVGGDLTRINSISFTVDDATPLRTQAREKAVKDALSKAQQIASAAGVGLGKPIYINESGSVVPRAMSVQSLAAGDAMAVAPTSISPGEMELSVSVQVVFEMK